MADCLVCGLQEAFVSGIHNMDACTIECKRCGKFMIGGFLPRIWETMDEEDKSLVPYL